MTCSECNGTGYVESVVLFTGEPTMRPCPRGCASPPPAATATAHYPEPERTARLARAGCCLVGDFEPGISECRLDAPCAICALRAEVDNALECVAHNEELNRAEVARLTASAEELRTERDEQERRSAELEDRAIAAESRHAAAEMTAMDAKEERDAAEAALAALRDAAEEWLAGAQRRIQHGRGTQSEIRLEKALRALSPSSPGAGTERGT